MSQRIQLRRGTASEWLLADPVLLPGEQGYESTTNRIKIGDGVSRWSQLSYQSSDTPELADYLPLSGGDMTSQAEVSWTNTLSDTSGPGGLSRLRLYDDGTNVAGMGISASNYNFGTIGAINLSVYCAGALAARYSTGLTRHYPDQFFNSHIYVSGSGSASSPQYSFEGDGDTGVYSPYANAISVSTAGTERLRVGSLGNFGIDTAPQASVAFGIDYSWTEIGSSAVIVHSSKGTPSTTCTAVQMYRAQPNIQSTGATTYGFNVAPATVTGSGTIANQIGFHCNDLGVGSTAMAFRGRVNTSPGNTRYNLYMDGTAPNYLGGQVQAGSASAASPSVSFVNDTDTGTYSPAANQWAVAAAGQEKLRVEDDVVRTTVGLALNTLQAPLPVDMTAVALYTSRNVPLGGGSSWNVYAGGTSPNYFRGSVGFNTTSPETQVDINANAIRIRTASTPASATDTGKTGEIRWDANYLYVCIATDTWKRAALSTW